MKLQFIVELWFKTWESGDFKALPISENFKHTSPYGTIIGKKNYLDLVRENKDKFLGHEFEIHDALYEENRTCVRYTAVQGDFRLDVSEWLYIRNNQIEEIISYYNIEKERITIDF